MTSAWPTCRTLTGAAKAVGKVLPELEGKLHGIAARVPVPDGSVVDLFVKLGRSVEVQEVNDAVLAAAEGPLKGILEYCERPIVSSDIIGNSHSSIFDAGFTGVTGGQYLRVLNWYDNEWGYSCRVCDLLERVRGW
jgi:glyceraldehyde 3-phosphate dehydrogenase